MKQRECWFLLMLLWPWWAQGEIYKWLDAQGNVHFGDVPPEAVQVEKVAPNTDNAGVQLSNPESAAQWKQDALDSPAPSAGNNMPAKTDPLASSQDFQQTDWCEGVVGSCFTEDQDRVCKLRYGTDCARIYHWKVCLHQNCEDNRLADKCDSPFYFLDKRPVMLGRRDLGRSLPIREWVSDRDWQCLSVHGFFCDEVAHENQCEEDYRLSCDELKNWVEAARERCVKSRDSHCDAIDTLIRYRPAPVEEVKKAGTMNAAGHVITQDLLLQSQGIYKNDPQDFARMQPVLESLTGLNIGKGRRTFDCERTWPN